MSDSSGSQVVAVLLYPGCIFFEIALAAEQLAGRFELRYYTPDGAPHAASNGAMLLPAGTYRDLASSHVAAVLVPGGDPGSIVPAGLATDPLQAAAARGSLMAGICAGNLVLASAGLLKGRRGTHNYTLEHAPAQKVTATQPFWEGLRFERADVVVDGLVITAQPWAHAAFAAAVAQALGVLDADQAQALVADQRRSWAGLESDEPRLRPPTAAENGN